MLDVMVLNVGTLPYAPAATRVLDHYMRRHGYTLHYWTSLPRPDVPPSWYKLLCHQLVKSDFILCWDLDLLPRRDAEPIADYLDRSRLNLAVDTSVLYGQVGLPNFRYNGGLIGIPAGERAFCENIFTVHAPGTRPSYEQYYLNDALVARPVHEIPSRFNTCYPLPGFAFADFERAECCHYTWGIDGDNKRAAIARHCETYFG